MTTQLPFYYITDLLSAASDQELQTTEPVFLISTVCNFAENLKNGKISKVSMLIVDNGHALLDSQDGAALDVIEFIRSALMKDRKNKDIEDNDIGNPQSSPCWQSRVVVFTGNFLSDTQTNTQLIQVEKEFDRLQKLYVGNKVNLIQNRIRKQIFRPINKIISVK